MAEDFAAQIRDVARALNRVRTNGDALAAAQAARRHGQDMMARADARSHDFSDSFRGAGSGAAIMRALGSDLSLLASEAKKYQAPSQAGHPVGTGWPALRARIERVYIDGTAVYALEENGVSLVSSLAGDLEQSIVRYGKTLEKEGVIGGAGKIIGDVAHSVGKGGSNIETGVGAGVKDLGHGATSLLGGLFSGWWPVLLVVGVAGAAYIFAPALARKAIAG